MTSQIIPSLMACPVLEIREYVLSAVELGVETFHIDIMDRSFVDNFAMTPGIIPETLKLSQAIRLQVHLMINKPLNVIKSLSLDEKRIDYFVHQGQEGCLEALSRQNTHMTFNLFESVTIADDLSSQFLAMAVPIGRCGQQTDFNLYKSLSDCSKVLALNKLTLDGGVKVESIKELKKFGLKGLVMGSGIFQQNQSPLSMTKLALNALI